MRRLKNELRDILKDFARDVTLELSHFIFLLLTKKNHLVENVWQCPFSNSESSGIPWRRSGFGDRQTSLYSCPMTRWEYAWISKILVLNLLNSSVWKYLKHSEIPKVKHRGRSNTAVSGFQQYHQEPVSFCLSDTSRWLHMVAGW